MKYIVDIKDEIEDDYEIIGKYEGRPQVNVIPQECIKVLAETVVDVVQQIDWTSLCEKVAERPQGKWIDRMADEGYVECPFCHKQITGGDLNFCVKCGAEMRKGKEVR